MSFGQERQNREQELKRLVQLYQSQKENKDPSAAHTPGKENLLRDVRTYVQNPNLSIRAKTNVIAERLKEYKEKKKEEAAQKEAAARIQQPQTLPEQPNNAQTLAKPTLIEHQNLSQVTYYPPASPAAPAPIAQTPNSHAKTNAANPASPPNYRYPPCSPQKFLSSSAAVSVALPAIASGAEGDEEEHDLPKSASPTSTQKKTDAS